MRSLKRVQAAAILVIGFSVLASCDKTDPTAPDNSTINVSANPASLRLVPGESGRSNITAVVEDADGRPLSGIRVRFETNAGVLQNGADGSQTSSNGVATDVLTLRFGDPDATVVARASGATSDSVTVTAGSNAAPVAEVQVSATAVRTGQSVRFDGSHSSDADGSIASYLWQFHSGDGDATATTAIVNKSFTTIGDVTGTLTVTDNEGKTGSKDIPTVSVVANIAPVAKVTPTTQTVNVNGIANFNATTSTDVDGTVLAYDWNWGDGSSLERTSSATPTHAYASAGSKTVRLTVWDNGTLAACPTPSTTAGQPPCTGSLESAPVTVTVVVNP
jgi:PKD repeat protein